MHAKFPYGELMYLNGLETLKRRYDD